MAAGQQARSDAALGTLRQDPAMIALLEELIEIDRPRLEPVACECYEVMRRRIERIVAEEDMTPRGHAPPAPKMPRARNPPLEDKAPRGPRTHGATSVRPSGH